MKSALPKRNYRDSLFRKYFENTTDLAAFHKLLTGITVDPQDIKITTLKGALFNNQKNDISFQVGNRFTVLLEHQSTINPNMPLRMLFYSAMLYRRELPQKAIYTKHLLPLPTPEFYVLYNGTKPLADQTLRLSDAFAETGAEQLELIVNVRNIRYNEDNNLLKNYRPLHDYSFFVYEIERLRKAGYSLTDSIRTATNYCIDHNIMQNFLLEHYEEVFDMLSFRWDENEARKVWSEEDRAEGRAEGQLSATINSIKQLMKNMNWSAESAMTALGIAKADYGKYMALL